MTSSPLTAVPLLGVERWDWIGDDLKYRSSRGVSSLWCGAEERPVEFGPETYHPPCCVHRLEDKCLCDEVKPVNAYKGKLKCYVLYPCPCVHKILWY